MNFKTYLIEEHLKKNLNWNFSSKLRRTSEVDVSQTREFIKKHCSDIVTYYQDVSHEKIWRGSHSHESYMLGDSTQRDRQSKNTFNYYTLMMDNFSSWKNYPKRSKSFICSTSKTNAGAYGDVFLVFPENATKIAVCPATDIWYTKSPTSSINFYYAVQCIIKLAHIAGIKNLSEDNFESFKQQIDAISKYFKQVNVSDLSKIEEKFNVKNFEQEWVFDNFIRKNKKDLYKTLEKTISPSKFGLYTTNTLQLDQPNNEVWFSGRAIFVSEKQIKTTVKNFLDTL